MRGQDTASSFVSPHNGTEQTDTAPGGVVDDVYALYVAFLVILQALGNVPFACVVALLDDPRGMSEFPHQPYSASPTFRKAALHSNLARGSYTGRAMQNYVAR